MIESKQAGHSQLGGVLPEGQQLTSAVTWPLECPDLQGRIQAPFLTARGDRSLTSGCLGFGYISDAEERSDLGQYSWSVGVNQGVMV